ncbi:D-TA family PLP-dependent enzyme [Heliorestis acidaminivorans]|uniref:D-TA family PLP-dependent enzyme n=1 Tax=Heliorestis acidaminivorans TaxID=553427 RepID=A0A6I0EZH4_9FIRM|nr:alanine racemase [Heliorestis acidaminivorans]KAB2953916.1 D-TA family PLP-dependent enzyme [Heliorestis acidaminivorans]
MKTQELGKKAENLTTPAILIDEKKLINNIERVAKKCKEKNISLRPHFKAHKLLPIAKLQNQYGAQGFTVAKLSEAEVLVNAGWKDILVAYPIWGIEKWNYYFELASQAKMSTIIDSHDAYSAWSAIGEQKRKPVEVYVKVDTGLQRVGYPPGEELYKLIRKVAGSENLIFRGLLTHAGHVYGAKNEVERKTIALAEGEILLKVARALETEEKTEEIRINEISVGSTPTVGENLETRGVTEVRPGNYVFNDATQVRLAVAREEDCALRVLTTVVANPVENRRIIDGGSKVFALDKGAHGQEGTDSYGIICNAKGWKLSRLSEEHGVLEKVSTQATELPVGTKLMIIPNHACPVINLTNQVYLINSKSEVKAIWQVDARGCSQ